ncbi:ankyrin repeat domain-containing protein 29-like [Physella acuta]|uniref:ankyrin repeat domain-containing protein 29-like n=1 Tax=Physella acuta TaxID=109671 RepID=UPI0027DAC79D|nr:ankyrin repeat domain-containing protein 29-like [Physella acuta]
MNDHYTEDNKTVLNTVSINALNNSPIAFQDGKVNSNSKQNDDYNDESTIDALLFAAEHGHCSTLKKIIDRWLSLNYVVIQARGNALLLPPEIVHVNVAQLLKKVGYDLNAVGNNGLNALMLASQNGHTDVVELLIDNGCDVNASNNQGNNALMLTSGRGHKEIVKLLLIEGSYINAVNSYGWNAIVWAATNGHDKVVQQLIKGGANSGCAVNAANKNGTTALMLASGRGHEGTAKLLLTAGSNVNAVDKDEWNALIFAAANGHDKVVQISSNEEMEMAGPCPTHEQKKAPKHGAEVDSAWKAKERKATGNMREMEEEVQTTGKT